MALKDLELSLMVFPQRWNHSTKKLTVNLLLLPLGNPLKPLRPVGGPPQFAGTDILVRAKIFSGTDLPTTGSIPVVNLPLVASPPAAAIALFNSLLSKLPAGTTVHTDSALPIADSARIHKALPTTYTNAIPFEKPRHEKYFTVGDGYGCALRAQDPGQLNPVRQDTPPKRISWGQILSLILRQPALARAVGMIHTFHVPVDEGDLKDGGWVYFALDDSSTASPYVSDHLANKDTVKSYGAMIPAVSEDRRIFAAQLFPLVATPGSEFTEALLEAAIYDDGFAQVLHCNQPATIDAASADDTQISPGAEAGIQIGWDDEQVTLWLNRQIDLLSIRAGGVALPTVEVPLGVQGYRVDVKHGSGGWRSLCKVNGALAFNGAAADGSGSTPSSELWVEPAPIRPIAPNYTGPNNKEAWLPLYFAQWRGGSLVIHDDIMTKITPGSVPMPANNLAPDLSQVPDLLYGEEYEFRVRLVDLTGGGAEASEIPLHEGLVAASTCAFRRHIAPKSLEVTSVPAPPAFPASPESMRAITNFAIRKPRIGYPEALFAGVDSAQFSGANLQSLIDEAKAAGRSMGVPDPDVDRFLVLVEARMPTHDTGEKGVLAGQVDGNFRVIYSVLEHFTVDDPDPVVNLSLDYLQVSDIAGMLPPDDDAAALPIPTARDIRIRMIPLCAERSSYYGTATPPEGPATEFIVRKESGDEIDLFPFEPATQLRAYYFQPGNNLLSMMAARLQLEAQGLTLTAPKGTRAIFGCSAGLRHSLGPDRSSITFGSNAELLNHWLVCIAIDIQRDWTWNGFAEPAVQVYRDGPSSAIGSISYSSVVADSASGDGTHPANRPSTRVIFFDGLQPAVDKNGFPETINPRYTLNASFKAAPELQQNYSSLVLPITSRPKQTPKIVATGLVESPFQASDDYSETFPRDRFLWIEFDQPIADKNDDGYFGRVLGYGPDPLLSSTVCPPNLLPVQPDADFNIDPEPLREIFAGQPADKAGLDAMAALLPPDSSVGTSDGRHYLLPLPPGISAEMLELFGFWTYEFRVGHQKKWTTAQARYGRPLRIAGLQHPAPHLACTVDRSQIGATITAPYATTVLNGVRVYDLRRGDPQTEIWVMLYAQVMQADRAAHRNILLTHRKAGLIPEEQRHVENAGVHATGREPRGSTFFEEQEIQNVLRLLKLPRTSSLSVLAVELLPGAIHFEGQPTGKNEGVNADPVGKQLGSRRILRTSNLTPVPAIC